MSGHSHWAGIKHKKGVADQKRGQVFSKLLNAVAIAARAEPNPQFNPQLKNAVDRAKEQKVPQENIERAIRRASEDKNLEHLILEAYGPEGAAFLVEAITSNKNRTIPEIKKILSDHDAKWAEPGGVRWAFDEREQGRWAPKFPQAVSEGARTKIEEIAEALLEHGDVQEVYTNV